MRGDDRQPDAMLVFFADSSGSVYRVGDDNELHVFAEQKRPVKSLTIGPTGQLFAAEQDARQLVEYDATGKRTVIARGVAASHITVTSSGRIYALEPAAHRIVLVDENRRVRTVADNLSSASALQLTKDQGWLFMTQPSERLVYSFQVQADGSLSNGQPYCYLEVPGNKLNSGADGMSIDSSGRLYVANRMASSL